MAIKKVQPSVLIAKRNFMEKEHRIKDTEVLCDRCKRSFLGEDWMVDTSREILCPDCWRDSREDDVF